MMIAPIVDGGPWKDKVDRIVGFGTGADASAATNGEWRGKLNALAAELSLPALANGESRIVTRGKINAIKDGLGLGLDLDFYADFTAGRLWDGGPSSPAAKIVDTHAQAILMPDADGKWVSKAANALCLEKGVGLQTVPTRTNQVLRSAFTGAVVGVVGAGGALPSGMSWSGGGGTSAVEVLSIFTDSRGLPRIRLKLSASTNTSGATGFPRFRFVSGVALADATPWTGSAFYNLMSTTHPINSILEGSAPYDSLGAGSSIIPAGESFLAKTGTKTVSGGTTVQFIFGPSLPVGEAFECVIEFAAPQMEQGAFATPPILTTGVASTRGGTRPVMTGISSDLAIGICGYIKVDIKAAGSDFVRLFDFNDGSSGNRFGILSSNGNWMLYRYVGGGSQGTINLGPSNVLGVQTFMYCCTSGFMQARKVGSSMPAANLLPAWPTMSQVNFGVDYAAPATGSSAYLIIKDFAYKAGSQSQATADAMYAIAQAA